MTPFYADDWLQVYGGDCREVLRELPAESVHCVVTSPPYWGLRDYGTASWMGGDPGCDHSPIVSPRSERPSNGLTGGKATVDAGTVRRGDCVRCGATRQDSQLGLEPTPEEYVAAMVDVFREVRRVLRADGTVWLNLGDSYASGEVGRVDNGSPTATSGPHMTGHQKPRAERRIVQRTGLKPKDLVGIPWRVAFALQADGWYLRSDVIWSKPNPMPESVTDRPTKSHEYLFLLSKSARYYWDADAVREDAKPESAERYAAGYRQFGVGQFNGSPTDKRGPKEITPDQLANLTGRNIRSVWTIATAPYPGAHFATFPPKLVEPCIRAGTSERGVCPECGAPWERVVERTPNPSLHAFDADARGWANTHSRTSNAQSSKSMHRNGSEVQAPPPITTGWRPTCAHEREPVPATCLDLFAGTGTVGKVAAHLSRRAILIDLNPDYLRQCLARNAQTPLGLVSA